MEPTTLYSFAPPYDTLNTIETGWAPAGQDRGNAIVWRLSPHHLDRDLQYLEKRPRGVALLVVLPVPEELATITPAIPRLSGLSPHAVLPAGNLSTPALLKAGFAIVPNDVPGRVVMYLEKHGFIRHPEVRSDIRRIFELAPRAPTIVKLCRMMNTTRRTLGRHFEVHQLPVPSHWLQFARLLHVILRAQSSRTAMFRLATAAGYPDGFTMSNQLKRLIGLRPSEVRGYYGFEWIVERWLAREADLPRDEDEEEA